MRGATTHNSRANGAFSFNRPGVIYGGLVGYSFIGRAPDRKVEVVMGTYPATRGDSSRWS
jgi:hypothetical protein